jgi:NTP pyrophosphatase (non-canonical NTP hydrolase)
MKTMTITEAQKFVDDWINKNGVRYFNVLTNMAMLTEEVGEVARVIARTHGEQSFKKSDKGKVLSEELADVLFVLICIANQTGTDLEKAFLKNIEKKSKRDKNRHKQNPKLKKAVQNPKGTKHTK